MTPEQAASALGISVRTVYRRLAHLGRVVVDTHLTAQALSVLGLGSDNRASAGRVSAIDTIIGERGETDRQPEPYPTAFQKSSPGRLWPEPAHREAVEELQARVVRLDCFAEDADALLGALVQEVAALRAQMPQVQAKSSVRVSWGDWWARLFPARPAVVAEARQEKPVVPVYYANSLRGS